MTNPLERILSGRSDAAGRRPGAGGSRGGRVARTPLVVRLANDWWDRLISSVWSGSLADQTARYAAHRTRSDYLFNSLGLGLWGVLFPLLTVIATQLAGTEAAGRFSMAFVIANLLQFVGTYGVRTYQVSDVDEAESFGSYQLQRAASCLLMVGVAWLWCLVKGYSGEMLSICVGTFAFRLVDSLADVYEGRLQQCDKLWLAGISQALRCGVSIASFTVALLVTHDVAVASLALAGAAGVSLLLVSLPLALLETPRSRGVRLVELQEIFVECAPAFAAQFLFVLIESVPKFAMEGALAYENQLFFNAIYFPAQGIAMTVGLVYKPQLVRLSNIWSEPNHRGRFDLIVIAVAGVAAALTAGTLLFNVAFGVPLLGILYGTDFEPMRAQLYLMVLAGGMSAIVDFLYQIITVLRRQEVVTRSYLLTFALSVVLSVTLVATLGFNGAVWAYFASMGALFVMLVVQYVLLRVRG